MSYKEYKYKDSKILLLPTEDFERNLNHQKDAKAIFKIIKKSVPEGEGIITINYEGRRYRFDDNEWCEFDSDKKTDNNMPRERKLKPSQDSYRINFKAVENAQAGKDSSFLYKFHINDHNLEGFHLDEYFSTLPQELDLTDIIEFLTKDFCVSSSELRHALASLDIGTFDIMLEKRKDRYELISFSQLTAHSNIPRKKDIQKKEISDLEEKNRKLKIEISDYKTRIQDYDKINADIGRLKAIEEQYIRLKKDLNIQENEEDIESLKIASKRNDVRIRLSKKIESFVDQDLRRFDISREIIEKTWQNVLDEMQSFTNHIEDNDALDELMIISELNDIKNVSNDLYNIYIMLLSDEVLFHFSQPSNRSNINISVKNSALKKYDLEFFEIPVGSADALPKVCRILSVKDSDYPRGTCLETVAYGIRRISDGSVIYKADVVISN